MTDEHRQALLANRDVVDNIPVVSGHTAGALVPQNMGQALELAKLMASGKVGVPKHMRNEPAVCLRVITDAMQFGLNPFHLASESFVINDQLAYGAKAVHAMAMRSGVIVGRLSVAYKGEGAALTCTVTGRCRDSATTHVKTCRLANITTKNSPLWKTDPQQQLGYYTERAWCRLFAPDAMMGLVAREDAPLNVTADAVTINGEVVEADAVARVETQLGMNGAADDATETVDPETGEILEPETGGHVGEEFELPPIAKETEPLYDAKQMNTLTHMLGTSAAATSEAQLDSWLASDKVQAARASLVEDLQASFDKNIVEQRAILQASGGA